MEITTNEIEYCKLQVNYEADKDKINLKRDEVLKAFKDAPVKGFRPKTASLEVIKIQYRKQIDDATKRALMEQAFHDTLFEKELKPFGTPNFTTSFLQGNKFSCSFEMQIRPSFELAPYKNLELPKQPIQFTTEELTQQFLQELRIRFGDSIPFTESDFVQMGDNVIIDYDCFSGDIKLDNLCVKGELLTVGRSQLEGFDNNLLGMKVGDVRDFLITVPDTGLPSIAGKLVKFSATLIMGSKIQPMALDDELAKKMEKKNFAELLQYCTGMASAKVNEMQRQAQVQQLSAKLVADNEIKVPDFLKLSEAQYLVASAKLKWEELKEEDINKFLSVGETNVKLSLILEQIREKEPEAQLSDQEILSMLSNSAKQNGQDPDKLLKSMSDTGYLMVLANRMRDEFVLDFVLKQAIIVE